MRLMTDVTETIDAHTYPATTEEIIEAYGEMEIELPNGDEQLGEALGRLGSETFETAEDARLAAFSAVSSNAIGRKGYSDRDPVCPGEDGHDEVSL